MSRRTGVLRPMCRPVAGRWGNWSDLERTMDRRQRLEVTTRRDFTLGTSAALVLLSYTRAGATAQVGGASPTAATAPAAAAPAAAPDPGATFDQAYAALTKGVKPTEGRITLEVPEIAENGNVVPFTVTVDHPMSDTSHIKSVHLLSTANPQPHVATFHFTPVSGKASVASRMRLAKTQDVVVLAELADGKLWVSRSTIKVTIGGCGG